MIRSHFLLPIIAVTTMIIHYVAGILPFILVDLLSISLLLIVSRNSNLQHNLLQHERENWILHMLSRVTGMDNRALLHLDKSPDRINDWAKQEIGLLVNPILYDPIFPDVKYGETELVKVEEQASFVISAIIFLPVVFGLIHLFREVHLWVFILEMHITLVISQLIFQSQERRYVLDGWTNMVDTLQQLQHSLQLGPRMFSLAGYLVQNPFGPEIGLDLKTNTSPPSLGVTSIFLQYCSQLPPHHRDGALDRFLQEIQQLPRQETIHEKRWNAYQTRLLLITSVGSAVVALLASLSQFSLNSFSGGIIPIQTTSYMPIGMFVLYILIAYLGTSRWLSMRKIIYWMMIWTITYGVTLSLTSSLLDH